MSTQPPRVDHYKNAGVDIEAGDAVVDWLQSGHVKFKHPKGLGELSDGIGGFAGLFKINFSRFKSPILVSSTDGVGTKLLLGIDSGRVSNLGQDLVAMCVNDLYTVGAIPLFFLDYYATGALDQNQFKQVLSSIKDSCKTCDMALLGGETAEMPGLYEKSHFDLGGFVVGVVDESQMLGQAKVKVGDRLIAFQSSGFHSNGYSLIRKWLKEKPVDISLLEKLLIPTKLYKEVPQLVDSFTQSFHALANITGGGISGNLPRVLPHNTAAEISWQQLPTKDWMKELFSQAFVDAKDVETVFNLGCGMIAVVDEKDASRFVKAAQDLNLYPQDIGRVISSQGDPSVIYV